MSTEQLRNQKTEFLLRLKIEAFFQWIISALSMNEEKPESKIKTRMIEIDRRVAAQLADVWIDMRQKIQSDVASSKKEGNLSKLKHQVKQD